MKRKNYFGLLLLLVCSTASARDFYFEARGAYFYPISDRFREINPGAGIYGLEFDWELSRFFLGWLEVDYYTQRGHTQGDHDSTRVDMIRYSLGLKYIYSKYFIKPYVGIGPAATWLHTHVDSSFLIRSESRWGLGLLAKAGVFFMLPKSFFIDLFTDYSLQTINMGHKDHKRVIINRADLSGLSFGGGLGYRF